MKAARTEEHSLASQADAASGAARFHEGDVIGERYELREFIGVGAMGAVYRAHDRVLDAEVALKLMRLDPTRVDVERATQRLLQEARAIARISHVGIVRVFDFGCVGGVPFIAMELLHGEPLLDFMLREGPLDPERAVRTLLPIADAIAVAHSRAVVHRDIKPENVFLAQDEFGRVQPKLVDFGVARLQEGTYGLTRPGALMGTPDYMAPEQAEAEPDVDQRADVWGFAVVLYELMTLKRPFSNGYQANYFSVLKAIVNDAPTPLSAHGIDDPALGSILEKALAKRREERWQSLRELGEALCFWLMARGVREDAYGASLRSRWLVATHSAAAAPFDGEAESITLRRPDAAPAASSVATPAPPALAAPPLLTPPNSALPLPTAGVNTRERRAVATLASTRLRRLSPLALAGLAALVSALATAALCDWVLPRLHGAQTRSVTSR